MIRLLSSGQDVADALTTTFTQFPLVFLAGFMLSEPLTLPPRRWQQLTVAAVVAVLFSTVFSIGPFTNTPELALVVGNLVAFAFGQRRGIRLAFVGKRQLTPTTWEFAFRPMRPALFRAGQYLELTVPHRADFRGSRRIFSISSAPTTDGPLTVALSVPEKPSSFKRAFVELETGTTVRATGIGGDFALPKDPSVPVVLIAGGIGITPFASQVAHDHELGIDRDIVVVYSVRHNDEIGYGELLETTGVRVVLVSPTEPERLPQNWTWAGNGRVSGDLVTQTVPDVTSRRVYVSGPPAMVSDIRAALRSLGVKRVTADYFSGY
jgi:ferredoxin-NADP reductase